MSEKKQPFIGNGFLRTVFGNVGFKGSISRSQLTELLKDESVKDKAVLTTEKDTYYKIEIVPVKNPEQGKPTHSIKLDTYMKSASNSQSDNDSKDDDLPF